MKYFVSFFFLIIMNSVFGFSFLEYFKSRSTEKQIPHEDKIMLKVIDNNIQKLEKKYNIYPCGFGLRGDKFEHVTIEFKIFQPMTKDQLRALLFDCLTELLDDINSNKNLKIHLKEYPFTLKNVGMVFYIRDKNYEELSHPQICVAEWSSNGVIFHTNDPEDTYKYKEIVEETNEEALALVKKYQAEKKNNLF